MYSNIIYYVKLITHSIHYHPCSIYGHTHACTHVSYSVYLYYFLQAVDSNKKSGHGRAVLCFYHLCEEIWGGSPATEQMSTGIDTDEVNQQENSLIVEEDQQVDMEKDQQVDMEEDQLVDNPTCSSKSATQQPTSSSKGAREESTSSSKGAREESTSSSKGAREESTSSSKGAREESTSSSSNSNSSDSVTLMRKRQVPMGYRHQKMKKKLPADAQMAHFAERDLEIKERMIERMDRLSSDQKEALQQLTSNIHMLNSSIVNAFQLLQKSLTQPSPQSSNPQLLPQYYTPPPAPWVSYFEPIRHDSHTSSDQSTPDQHDSICIMSPPQFNEDENF